MVSIGLLGIDEYPKNLLVLFWSIFTEFAESAGLVLVHFCSRKIYYGARREMGGINQMNMVSINKGG